MSDEIDRPDQLDGEERRLADLFGAVDAPYSMRRWDAPPAARRAAAGLGSRLIAALIGAAGERRLRPLAAALVLPLLVLAVGGGMGLRAHLSGTGGSGPNPPARAEAAMAFDAGHGVVVMFGGLGSQGSLGDTWTWDGDSWTQQHPPASPPAGWGAAMAYDATHHEVVMFGGHRMGVYGSTQQPSQETWTWDGSTWHQAVTSHQPATLDAGMAFDPATGQLLLVASGFGVATASVSQGLNAVAAPAPARPLPSGVHTFVPTPGTSGTIFGGSGSLIVPVPAASSPTMAFGPDGGVGTWVWSGSDWVRTTDAASAPTGAFGALYPAWNEAAGHVELITNAPVRVCTFDGPHGGSGSSSATGTSMSWSTGESLPAPAPSRGASPTVPGATVPHPVPISPVCPMTAPPDVHNGCFKGCSPFHDWRWDGKAWQQVKVSGHAPGQRLVSDPATGGLITFNALATDVLRGGVWSSTSNPADLQWRSGPAVAGDAAHKVVVLFGGRAPGGFGSDTWTWDGHAWTHRGGAAPPSPPPHAFPTFNPAPSAATACGVPEAPTLMVTTQPSGTVIRITEHQPLCAPLVVRLEQAFGGALLDVRGNGVTVNGGQMQTLTWLNWCGSNAVEIVVTQGTLSVHQQVARPPACLDRAAPSTLYLGLAGNLGTPGVLQGIP